MAGITQHIIAEVTAKPMMLSIFIPAGFLYAFKLNSIIRVLIIGKAEAYKAYLNEIIPILLKIIKTTEQAIYIITERIRTFLVPKTTDIDFFPFFSSASVSGICVIDNSVKIDKDIGNAIR